MITEVLISLTVVCALTLSLREGGIMQIYSPGVSCVLQQQTAYASMGQCIPVDAIFHAMLQAKAEVEVKVQDIQSIGPCQLAAIEIGLNDVVTQRGAQVVHLL